MKVRNFLVGAAAALMSFVSCDEPGVNLGAPKIVVDPEVMTFEAAGGEQTASVTATRDWIVEDYQADWVVVTPEGGEAAADAQTVSVSVLPNEGMDREVSIKFTIGMASRYLTVKQAGPGGSAEQLILFFNDFDKEEATKTFGSGESWPYLDQFEGWKNETGSGAANIEYAFKAMSARANSTSDSNYSDYEGSGSNNMFFGKDAYLAVKNIALNGSADLKLTFGTEKYSQTLGSVFTPSEYHIFLSQDGGKWVEFKDYTFAGGDTEGRWNLATALFSVPAGTENLSICMKVDAASSYRMDDLKLEVNAEKGTAVDFSNAVEMDFGAGSTGGGNGGGVTPPANIKDVTVAEFNAAAVSTTEWYRLEGTVGGPINATYGNFDLVDATGKVYVYGISNWSEYKDKVAEGGKVVVVGQRGDYNGKIEVLEGYIESYDGSTAGGGNGGGNTPADIKDVTVEQFNAAAVSTSEWYRLKGTVGGPINDTYGNFDLIDETGKVYVYGIDNWSAYKSKVAEGGSIVIVGQRGDYNGKIEVLEGYIESYNGETAGGGNGGGTPPAGEPGKYDPQGITWTLGSGAYDGTMEGNICQKGTINGVSVNNLLKLGKGSDVGSATLHVPAGTKKVGAYIVAWKGKTSTNLKFSVGGTEVKSLTPKANDGATGNPPYTITVTEADWYEMDVPTTEAVDVKVETTDPAQGRVIIIGLKAITE